jgi:hypothetical protein
MTNELEDYQKHLIEWAIRKGRLAVFDDCGLAKRMTGGLVYLASPYSHPDPAVRLARFEAANRVAAILMARGILVFSPLSHSHPIALAGCLPLSWDYWERYDRAILRACGSMLVLTIDGWRELVGVRAEVKIARELGFPVGCVDVNGAIDEMGGWE